MKAKHLAILNFVSVLAAIFASYYTQAIHLNGNTMQSLSEKYFSLFTPAGYAFSIWGIIYLGLLAFGIYQLYQAFGPKRDLDFLIKSKYWFFIANIANAIWIFAWFYEFTGLSVAIMLLILFSLLKIVVNTNMERWDAPFKIIAFSWWPICLYSGWIVVATIANISAWLAKFGWIGGFLTEIQWTIVLILIATVINILMIYTRNMREFALVGIWALVAIYVRHSTEILVIAYTALGCAVLIGLNVAYHGFKNRKTNPMHKLINK